MSVISNVAFVGAVISGTGGLAIGSASCVLSSVITPFSDQLKVTDTSQLINGIFNVFQKLLKCFNGSENSTSFVFHH